MENRLAGPTIIITATSGNLHPFCSYGPFYFVSHNIFRGIVQCEGCLKSTPDLWSSLLYSYLPSRYLSRAPGLLIEWLSGTNLRMLAENRPDLARWVSQKGCRILADQPACSGWSRAFLWLGKLRGTTGRITHLANYARFTQWVLPISIFGCWLKGYFHA